MPATLASTAQATSWLRSRVTGTLRSDSRAVTRGDAFIAWPGSATDGRRYVADALQAGASACLVEAEGAPAYAFDDPRVAALAGLKAACGAIADAWFDHPAQALEIVAATGTNGKTSTVCWTAQALAGLEGGLSRRAGVIGTLGAGEWPVLSPTGLTTPDPITLHATLRRLADAGVAVCAIEASSIGIVEHRLDGLAIDIALFTNFTRDHLDYHGSMTAYWAAKRALFDWPGLRAAVLNVDDEQGAQLAEDLRGGALDLWSISIAGPARLCTSGLRYEAQGLAFEVIEAGSAARGRIRSTLVGEYNASNLLVVLGALRALGVPLPEAAAALSAVTAVPGRMQRLAGREVEVVVDYAHTPDALDKVLAALRPLATARHGRLWCVFGCGGDRDPSKRPLMGAIAMRGADRVVLTSDNPRSEAPAAILAQVLAGITGHDEVDVIEERQAAIAHAVAAAGAGDVVLVAGKGHEQTQEVAGRRLPFSDLAHARAALARREAAPPAAGAGA